MSAMQHDNGVFWIDYESLLRFFQGVYLNWNPQLFRYHTATHAQWPAPRIDQSERRKSSRREEEWRPLLALAAKWERGQHRVDILLAPRLAR